MTRNQGGFGKCKEGRGREGDVPSEETLGPPVPGIGTGYSTSHVQVLLSNGRGFWYVSEIRETKGNGNTFLVIDTV